VVCLVVLTCRAVPWAGEEKSSSTPLLDPLPPSHAGHYCLNKNTRCMHGAVTVDVVRDNLIGDSYGGLNARTATDRRRHSISESALLFSSLGFLNKQQGTCRCCGVCVGLDVPGKLLYDCRRRWLQNPDASCLLSTKAGFTCVKKRKMEGEN
jgi:hypothetical protein